MPAATPSPAISLAAPWPRAPELRALLMGIVNVTPDSFSDGGQFESHQLAIAHGLALAAEGADIVDVGGESTRPGFAPVEQEEEARRVIPVIAALHEARPSLAISIDSYKAATARSALKAGATIVNDVWGLQRDPAMADVVAEAGAGLAIMHNPGEIVPERDIVADMRRFFERSLTLAEKAGIPRGRIALDPGVGFGKTLEQNLDAILAMPLLRREYGSAMLLGVSRKSFLGAITGKPVTARHDATIAANSYGAMLGADVLRVHDIGAHRDAALVIAALNARPSSPIAGLAASSTAFLPDWSLS
jgi:dihydropteroate synthase